MSGLIDGVSKVFVVYHEMGSMHIDGSRSFEEAAMQCLKHDSYKGDFVARLEAFKATIDKAIFDHTHEHAWSEGKHGGAICSCGEFADEAWYCPSSPSHLCSYESGDEDHCDYCELPAERK